jgi:membrane protease YdiL (CAAX protease family)
MEDKRDEEGDASATESRIREVLFAFLGTAALVFLLDLIGRSVPVIGNNLLTIVAVVFLLVPIGVLKFRGRHDTEYGLGFYDLGRGIRWGLALTVLTLVGFVPAFHFYHAELRGFAFEPDVHLLSAPPDRTMGRPADVTDGDVHIYSSGEWTFIRWSPPEGTWSIEVSAHDGLAFHGTEETTIHRSGKESRPVGIQLIPVGTGDIEVSAMSRGHPVPAERLQIGAAEKPAREAGEAHIRVPVNYWWVATMFIVQLLLVALPEEFFYRGYLQERLSEGMGRRRIFQLGPIYLTWPIIITSLLFAIGHVIIGWQAQRLLVFFPSLLFGFLRDRTDGITAPILYHAACNMMVQLASAFYFPS